MYKLVVAGGTFDLLHKGHKSFLQKILAQTERLFLGLTSDNFINANKNANFENYDIRIKNLEDFLSPHKNKVEIVPINDIYGPLLDPNLNVSVLAVTDQTLPSVSLINSKREELGMYPLRSIIIPMDLAEDGEIISSTRIRNGEINREGRLYFKKEWKNKMLKLPDSVREMLHKPFGEVLNEIPQNIDEEKTITVGDVTSMLFNQSHIKQKLSIVDYKVHREKKFDNLKELGFDSNINKIEIKNEASTLTPEIFQTIKEAMGSDKRTVILIEGEEDLSVIPSLLVAPLGYQIFYGQPARLASQPASQAERGGQGESVAGRPSTGLVRVEVTEENKEKAYRLLNSFDIET